MKKPPPQNISHQSISPLPTPKPIPAKLPNIIYEVCVSMIWTLVISINRDKVRLHWCAACAPWRSCVRLRAFCWLFESREEGTTPFCTVPKPHGWCQTFFLRGGSKSRAKIEAALKFPRWSLTLKRASSGWDFK